MYFSVITPSEGLLRQAAHEYATPLKKVLAQPSYAEHQWLWRFFPGQPEQLRDFIFRRHETDHLPHFYVVSPRPPVAYSDAWQVQSREYHPQLEEGQHLSFQLCANPVVSKKDSSGKSRRHDVVMQAKRQLLLDHGFGDGATWKDWSDESTKPLLYELVQKSCSTWLQTRANNHGFFVASVNVDSYQQIKAGKRNIQFSTVDFSGQLIVTNPKLFTQLLLSGLGHAKAFGCGLLLVKKLDWV